MDLRPFDSNALRSSRAPHAPGRVRALHGLSAVRCCLPGLVSRPLREPIAQVTWRRDGYDPNRRSRQARVFPSAFRDRRWRARPRFLHIPPPLSWSSPGHGDSRPKCRRRGFPSDGTIAQGVPRSTNSSSRCGFMEISDHAGRPFSFPANISTRPTAAVADRPESIARIESEPLAGSSLIRTKIVIT